MKKTHSTVSRRDFMKGLGLGVAGIGAAAAAVPVLHDMDEVIQAGDPTSMQSRPWFVKEQDNLTIDVDLNLRRIRDEAGGGKFDSRDSVIGGGRSWGGNNKQYIEEKGQDALTEIQSWLGSRQLKSIEGGTPGSSLRDYALGDGIRSFDEIVTCPVAGFRKKKTPEQRGVPKFTGTPEEMANTIRTMVRAVGFSHVGFIALDDYFFQLAYDTVTNRDADTEVTTRYKLRIKEGLDDYLIQGDTYYIPSKCRYLIYYQPQNSRLMRNGMPWGARCLAAGQAARDRLGNSWLHNTIHGLGYQAYGRGLFPGPAIGLFAGIEEYCRIHNGISYELGVLMGGSGIITDMPLPTTKPIDMGIVEFCKSCAKCADICPAEAIDRAKEPHWDRSTGPWNAPNDHTGWSNHSHHCYTVGCWGSPSICVQCSAACPFTKERTSWIHVASKGVASLKIAPFNGFMVAMDDFFGYGNPDLWREADKGDHEEFWNMDHQEGLIDPIRPNY